MPSVLERIRYFTVRCRSYVQELRMPLCSVEHEGGDMYKVAALTGRREENMAIRWLGMRSKHWRISGVCWYCLWPNRASWTVGFPVEEVDEAIC